MQGLYHAGLTTAGGDSKSSSLRMADSTGSRSFPIF